MVHYVVHMLDNHKMYKAVAGHTQQPPVRKEKCGELNYYIF